MGLMLSIGPSASAGWQGGAIDPCETEPRHILPAALPFLPEDALGPAARLERLSEDGMCGGL